MSESTPQIELKAKAFVFGSQDLSFNAVSFKNLHSQLHSQQWAVDVLASLPDLWDKLSTSGLLVQQSDSRHLLDNLNSWIASGKAPEAAFPLPNILLSPLVVICQLIDYLNFIQSGIPGLRDEDDFSKTFPEDMETLGLCIGTLSAFAVACSSNMADIQANGGVAIRLAMLIGATVDAEDDSREPERKSMSFSALSGGSESGESFTSALDSFTDVSSEELPTTPLQLLIFVL
jgi:hypothetical protein